MARFISIAAIALFAGCAQQSARPPHVYSRSQVDVPPQLIGCASYTPVLAQTRVRARVPVDFIVNADGSVANGSARPRQGGRRINHASVADRAARDALSCTFKPALVRDRPVAAQTSYLFSYTDW